MLGFFQGSKGTTTPRSYLNPPQLFMRLSTLIAPSLVAALAGTTQAQGDFTFQINQGASAFTWSGTTSLGDIVENPANFNLSGTIVVGMNTGGNPVGSGDLPGAGDALISPDISGYIPNPLPFLPNLADLDLANVHVRVSTPNFGVDGAGNFSTQATVEIISGSLIVSALGTMTSADLAGNTSAPEAINGTVNWIGTEYLISTPVNTTFPFSDTSSGVTGSITLVGTIVASHVPEAPNQYCTSTVNSSGAAGVMVSSGSPSIGIANLGLTTTGLPSSTFGIYFYGPTQVNLAFGDGFRCVGGSIQRLAPVNTGSLGSVSQPFTNAALPIAGQLFVNQRTNVQFWFRDVPAGGTGFNTSSALTILPMP